MQNQPHSFGKRWLLLTGKFYTYKLICSNGLNDAETKEKHREDIHQNSLVNVFEKLNRL